MTRRTMMMAMLGVAASLCVTLATPAKLLAHAGHGMIVGEVVSVTADAVEVKTAKETVTVKLTATTKFEKDKKPADKSLLLKGDRVGITATGKAGDLTATRIILGLPVPAAKAKPKTN